jgi:hypothetical protein
MDVFERESGQTTSEAVQQREDLRLIVTDVHALPESQRSALLLREMEALSYEQIALAMDTTVPAVKSLLVRARVSLAEANEARSLTCDEVRLELGRAEEGLGKVPAPVRRHVRSCDRCHAFRGELRRTSRALAAAYPVGVLAVLHNLVAAKLGGSAVGGAGAAGSTGAVGTGSAMGGAGAMGTTVSSLLAPLATKGVASLAAAALLTAGAVEVDHLRKRDDERNRSSRENAQARVPQTGTQRPTGEVQTGSKATGDAVADARMKVADTRDKPEQSSFLAPPQPRTEDRHPARDKSDEETSDVATADALEAAPADGAEVDPLVEDLPATDGTTTTASPDPAVPGATSHPSTGQASHDGVTPVPATPPATATTTTPTDTLPPVGGKSADTTGDEDAAADPAITPIREGHKQRSGKKRRARRAKGGKKVKGTTTTPSTEAPADQEATEPSPSAVAGAATPEGRRALKNLGTVGQ